jgi:hypothetical protein
MEAVEINRMQKVMGAMDPIGKKRCQDEKCHRGHRAAGSTFWFTPKGYMTKIVSINLSITSPIRDILRGC